MKRKLLFLAVIVLCGSCLFSCDSHESREASSNRKLFAKRIADTVSGYRLYSLKELTPFAWDTAYFFAPYTSAKHINETIGENWTDIPMLESEGMMAIVFKHQGKVIFSLFGHPSEYYISSSREVLYAQDDPKFILWRIYDNSFVKGPSLEWFDESLLSGETGTKVSENLAGPWEYEDGRKGVSLTLTEEGIAKGIIHYSFEKADETKQSGSGSIFFTGLWDGTAIRCRTDGAGSLLYSNAEAKSFPPASFDLVFDGDGFLCDMALAVRLLDGSLTPLTGLCRLDKAK